MRKFQLLAGVSMWMGVSLAFAAGAGGGGSGAGGVLNGGGGGRSGGGDHSGGWHGAFPGASAGANAVRGAGATRAPSFIFTKGTVNGQKVKIALVTLSRPLTPAEKIAVHESGYQEIQEDGVTYFCNGGFAVTGFLADTCFMTTVANKGGR
ncbi:MAG: hypothetical protein ABSH33_15520 [Steroidobacteraceae bacterium]|jgi:hypothetical protein